MQIGEQMDIPASCLFNKKKFKDYMSYTRMSGLGLNSKDYRYTVVNDISTKGEALDGALVWPSAVNIVHKHKAESSGLDSWNMEICLYKEKLEELHIPSVSAVYFRNDIKQSKIENVYIQPDSNVSGIDIAKSSDTDSKIEIKSLYMRAIPKIIISGIKVEELHIQETGRHLVQVQYIDREAENGGMDFGYGGIPMIGSRSNFGITQGIKLIIENKDIVAYTTPRVALISRFNQLLDANQVKIMCEILNKDWLKMCNECILVCMQDGNLRIGDTLIEPNNIPDEIWKAVREFFA